MIALDYQCTYWPDLWYKSCCIVHDLGGTDSQLFWCVLIKTIPWALGILFGLPSLMYIGVKVYKLYKLYKGYSNEK